MNSNLEHYEHNLQARLQELREGDRSYQLQSNAISEAIVMASDILNCPEDVRILDVGCGLGFLTAFLAKFERNVVGIDPSLKTIEIAKAEHPDLTFYEAGGENFSDLMDKEQIELFDIAVLNMVLHSLDDKQALELLIGLKKCLIKGGALIGVIPTRRWLQTKLIENAKSEGKGREEGITWVFDQLQKPVVDLKIKVRASGEYWPDPIQIYNRSELDYQEIVASAGYSAETEYINEGQPTEIYRTAYHKPWDNLNNYQLRHRKRTLFITFADKEIVPVPPIPSTSLPLLQYTDAKSRFFTSDDNSG